MRGDRLGDVEALLDVGHAHVHVVVLKEEELVGGTDDLQKVEVGFK